MNRFEILTTTAVDFKQALPHDLSLVIEISSEAAAWLSNQGIDQWPYPIPIHWQQRIAAKIASDEIYTVGVEDGRFGIVGLSWADPYWPDNDKAGYVHQMAIRTAVHGQGIGEIILRWAEQQVKQKEKRFLRLDCAARNGRLRQYYEDQGFAYRGQIIDHDYEAALYEIEVA